MRESEVVSWFDCVCLIDPVDYQVFIFAAPASGPDRSFSYRRHPNRACLVGRESGNVHRRLCYHGITRRMTVNACFAALRHIASVRLPQLR